MEYKTICVSPPKGIIKFPSFTVKNYKVRHVVKIPYIMPCFILIIANSEEGTLSDWTADIKCQMPGYKLDIRPKNKTL